MIQVEKISKKFTGHLGGHQVQALNELSFQVSRGEVFGFLGPNGAGKSTTIKILFDLLRPDSGNAYILGRNVRDKTVRKAVGYLPENPYYYDQLTAEELLWFAGKTSGLSKKEINEKSFDLLEMVRLSNAKKRCLRTFSKGMLQRLGLALALINNPDVIILDEPMSGLDPLGRKLVKDIIQDLKRQNKTVFFSTHILADVEILCDTFAVISEGELKTTQRVDGLKTADIEEIFSTCVSDRVIL